MTISAPQLLPIFKRHQNGQVDDAIRQYQILFTETDDTQLKSQCSELLGIAYGQLQQYQAAITAFKQALSYTPKAISIQNNLATCYKKTHQYKKACKLYLNILKHNPYQCVTMNNLASLYMTQDDHTRAIDYLKKAICLQPKYADAYFNLGLVLLNRNNPKAIPSLKKSASLGHEKAPYQIALTYESLEELENAKTYYLQSLEHRPNHADTHHGLGRTLLALNDDEEALHHFIQAQKIDPTIPHLMENIAAYYHVKGMHANAIEYWSKAPKDETNIIQLQYNIGVAYHYSNRHEEALEYFQQVLLQDPNHKESHMNIAAIALQNHQRQHAIIHYKKALELDPSNQEIQYILSAIEQTQHKITQSPSHYVSNLFDQYASYYDQHLLGMLKYQLPEKIQLALHEQRSTDPSNRIIDLGCGTGLMGHILKPFAKELIGVDLSANMLNKAQTTNLYCSLHQEDCVNFLKSQSNIDIIIAAELMPYIGDLTLLVQAMQHALNHKGMIIFSIETSKEASFHLTENARFQHNVIWVESLLKRQQFHIIESLPTTLRTHQGNPVSGQLITAQLLEDEHY
ncbi:tetratricopeptide repeat protein [Candidatus Synchoanobacter obligatus]|uniref:Tetratricopeptide repeat protein n=1 Tax=Candidatus Synchoanobacter obligatus TaxID=2919597 RepID=A0ABT1L3J7_9GAMM|nr:tetratricopeptide repeat protein [Candidatus Synchoanobacter obligatus]MCP8351782.1 tetratricopeptide repeat protein [Candidatus Synchoanobacter obligatus]